MAGVQVQGRTPNMKPHERTGKDTARSKGWQAPDIKDRLVAAADARDDRGASKYNVAVELAKDKFAGDPDVNKTIFRNAVDEIYNSIRDEGDYTAAEARGENPLQQLGRTIGEGIDSFNTTIGSGLDAAWDWAVGGLAEAVRGKEGGDFARNMFSAEDFAMIPDMAEDILLGMFGPAGIAAAVGKNAAQRTDQIAEALSGRDTVTQEKLSDSQRAGKAVESVLGVGLSAIPGVGKIHAPKAFKKELGAYGKALERAEKAAAKEKGAKLENRRSDTTQPNIKDAEEEVAAAAAAEGAAKEAAEETAEQGTQEAAQAAASQTTEEAAEQAAREATENTAETAEKAAADEAVEEERLLADADAQAAVRADNAAQVAAPKKPKYTPRQIESMARQYERGDIPFEMLDDEVKEEVARRLSNRGTYEDALDMALGKLSTITGDYKNLPEPYQQRVRELLEERVNSRLLSPMENIENKNGWSIPIQQNAWSIPHYTQTTNPVTPLLEAPAPTARQVINNRIKALETAPSVDAVADEGSRALDKYIDDLLENQRRDSEAVKEKVEGLIQNNSDEIDRFLAESQARVPTKAGEETAEKAAGEAAEDVADEMGDGVAEEVAEKNIFSRALDRLMGFGYDETGEKAAARAAKKAAREEEKDPTKSWMQRFRESAAYDPDIDPTMVQLLAQVMRPNTARAAAGKRNLGSRTMENLAMTVPGVALSYVDMIAAAAAADPTSSDPLQAFMNVADSARASGVEYSPDLILPLVMGVGGRRLGRASTNAIRPRGSAPANLAYERLVAANPEYTRWTQRVSRLGRVDAPFQAARAAAAADVIRSQGEGIEATGREDYDDEAYLNRLNYLNSLEADNG